jgi:hypothetical protein
LQRGQFKNPGGMALTADEVTVKGTVLLRNGFSAEGLVHLYGSKIEGGLELEGARFGKGTGLDVEHAASDWEVLILDIGVTLDLRDASIGLLSDERDSWPHEREFLLGVRSRNCRLG